MNQCRIVCLVGLATLAVLAAPKSVPGQTPVKYSVGALHGFLTIHSEAGANIGYAELSEFAVGDRVTVRFVHRFHDGSLDDETTIFTQGKTFQFVSDRHIQKGPFFPKPADVTIQSDGQITIRSTDKDGKTKVETSRMEVTPDLSNGMVGTILQNIRADAPEFKLGMIVPFSGKGRAIKLDVTPDGEQTFHIAGLSRKVNVFRVKTQIGGVLGMIAPLVGKKPADILVWVLPGEPPVIVRIVGPLGEGTANVSVDLAGATFPKSSAPAK